jgi:hypothetical protein
MTSYCRERSGSGSGSGSRRTKKPGQTDSTEPERERVSFVDLRTDRACLWESCSANDKALGESLGLGLLGEILSK